MTTPLPDGPDPSGPRPAGTQPPAGTGRRLGVLLLALASAAAHLVAGFFYLVSGLVAPLWAVVGLLLWWLALTVWLVHLARRWSWWTPAPPLVAAASWFAALTAGEQLLGWTP